MHYTRSMAPGDAKRFMEEAWRKVEPTTTAKPTVDRQFLRLRDVAALEALFATGMRVGELVKLTLPDSREDERTFIVRGKGSRQRLAFLPDSAVYRPAKEIGCRARRAFCERRRQADIDAGRFARGDRKRQGGWR
jgi:integrase/recombinase XerD